MFILLVRITSTSITTTKGQVIYKQKMLAYPATYKK